MEAILPSGLGARGDTRQGERKTLYSVRTFYVRHKYAQLQSTGCILAPEKRVNEAREASLNSA